MANPGEVSGEKVGDLGEKVDDLEDELENKNQQIDMIADIHQTLLPQHLPEIKGLSLAASHVAPEKAGGDYYDFLPFSHGEDRRPDPAGPWWIIVADAAGHGPAAAVIMAMVHSILHAYSETDRDPGKALCFINKQMADKNVEGSFVTALLALVDPVARTLSFACAGHHPPFLREQGGQVRPLNCDGGGPPLAVDQDARFESQACSLNSGEMFLFYTDGAVEADNHQEEQFGMERLKQALAAAPGEPAEAVRAINRTIAAHRKGEQQHDDKTLLILRVLD